MMLPGNNIIIKELFKTTTRPMKLTYRIMKSSYLSLSLFLSSESETEEYGKQLPHRVDVIMNCLNNLELTEPTEISKNETLIHNSV